MKVAPLGILLVLQYICLSITVSLYHPHIYFPGVRIVGLLVLLVVDVVGYVLWRSLVRPQFSVLRDLPQPPVMYSAALKQRPMADTEIRREAVS